MSVTYHKLGEKPTKPCPDPSKSYLWIDGKWVLLASDDDDGVPRKLSLPKKRGNRPLNSEPKE